MAIRTDERDDIVKQEKDILTPTVVPNVADNEMDAYINNIVSDQTVYDNKVTAGNDYNFTMPEIVLEAQNLFENIFNPPSSDDSDKNNTEISTPIDTGTNDVNYIPQSANPDANAVVDKKPVGFISDKNIKWALIGIVAIIIVRKVF